jgi:hypothetical protein
MSPVAERFPALLRSAEDKGALAEDALHRLAHWLAEVSAEATNSRVAQGNPPEVRLVRKQPTRAPR